MSDDKKTCPNCRTENPRDAIFCQECGINLVDTHDFQVVTFSVKKDPDLLIAQMRKRVGSFSESGSVILHLMNAALPLIVQPEGDYIIGRKDIARGTSPDLDLALFDGLGQGVSRKHAALRRKGNALYLVDLGSSNGTFLNGYQLSPNEPTALADNDLITLGRFDIRVFFQ